jgi:predicted ATPase
LETDRNIIGYVVITIGFFLALQNTGINLSALTVFAGAVGVGVGLGLQNISSNFISGLILLPNVLSRGSPENAFFKNRRNLLGTNFACSCRPQDIVGAGVNFRAVENLKLLNLPKNA